jgi:6-phosphofructokinase 1
MGRRSGYIASYATLANLDVNFCLIPEVDFDLRGPGGFFEAQQRRLYHRKHAVIVVAEGAGQKFFDEKSGQYDASGNAMLKDIGLYLREEIKKYFKEKKISIDLKYIDPSYMVRSVTTNANDSIYTADIARHAVHAAMAGKTDMMVGLWHGEFINLPLPVVINKTKKIDPESSVWMSVLSSTGQPMSMVSRGE